VRRPQLVHGEGEHVRGTWLAHPPLVQLGHGPLVDEQHGEFGQRVDPHLVQREPGDRASPTSSTSMPASLAISMLIGV
jgi:hypothetical protein